MEQITRQRIIDNINRLEDYPRYKKVLSFRFGLDDGVTHTLEETGMMFNVTRERIRQIETKAIEIMFIEVTKKPDHCDTMGDNNN